MTAGSSKGRLVLVVDPDLGFADALTALLASDRIIGARSMEEAAAIAEGGRIDLALVGPSYGTEAGVASAATLRDADRSLLTVLVADVPTNRVLRAALRSGFTDVVDAPVSTRKLAEVLGRTDALDEARSVPVVFESAGPIAAHEHVDLVPADEPTDDTPVDEPVVETDHEESAESLLPLTGPTRDDLSVVSETDATFAEAFGIDLSSPVMATTPLAMAGAVTEHALELAPEPLPMAPTPAPEQVPDSAPEPAPVATVPDQTTNPDPTPVPDLPPLPVFAAGPTGSPSVDPGVDASENPIPASPEVGVPVEDVPFAPPAAPETAPEAPAAPLPAPPAMPPAPELPVNEEAAAMEAEVDLPPMPSTPPPTAAPDLPPGLRPVSQLREAELAASSDRVTLFDEDSSPVPMPRNRPGAGRVITVMAGKGGSGKSITATNLAASLTEKIGEDKVVIVDADMQFGDVALMLQIDPARTILDAAAGIDDLTEPRLDSILLRHDSGLRVLPAPLVPAGADRIVPKDVVRIVEMLRGMYPFVIVDTAPIFDDGLITLLEHSDDVLLVVDMDLPSVKNAKIALDTLRATGFDTGKILVMVNRANSKARLDLAELERALGQEVAASIPSDRLVPQSVNEGVPAVAFSPRSRVAKAFHTLADLFLPA